MPQVRTTTLKRHYVFAKRSLYNKAIVKNTPIAYRLCSEIIKIYYSISILLFVPALRVSELEYFKLYDTPLLDYIMPKLFVSFVAIGLLLIPILLVPTTCVALICRRIFWRLPLWRYVLALIYQAWHFIIWSYFVAFLGYCIWFLFNWARH